MKPVITYRVSYGSQRWTQFYHHRFQGPQLLFAEIKYACFYGCYFLLSRETVAVPSMVNAEEKQLYITSISNDAIYANSPEKVPQEFLCSM